MVGSEMLEFEGSSEEAEQLNSARGSNASPRGKPQ